MKLIEFGWKCFQLQCNGYKQMLHSLSRVRSESVYISECEWVSVYVCLCVYMRRNPHHGITAMVLAIILLLQALSWVTRIHEIKRKRHRKEEWNEKSKVHPATLAYSLCLLLSLFFLRVLLAYICLSVQDLLMWRVFNLDIVFSLHLV